MQSDGDSGLNLEAQLTHKEREWKELQAVRVHQLESSLKKAQEECSTLRELYLQLREDFQFNLAILDEPDKELEKYDVITARALHVEHKSTLAGEMEKQTEEYEGIKRNLQCIIHELEGEVTLQKQVKMLSKETEIHCGAQLQATEAFKTLKEFCHQIQTQLQHQDQEIKGLIAVKDHRYKNVLLALKECDAKLEAQCHIFTELMQKVEKRIDKLQANMEVLTAQVHWSQKDHQKAMEEKDAIIQRLHKEVETTQTGWDKYISHVSTEMVVKKTEIINLRDREFKLREELDRGREEMERYKQQLCAGLEKERNLQQIKVQVELEWQRHCEDMKAKFYLAKEKLIQELTHARDQGFTPRVELLASEEICRLKEQNSILRAAVTQMRKDMECLNHPLFSSQAQPQATYPQPVQHPGSPAATSITTTVNTQMATRPPRHCTDLSSKVNLSDGQKVNRVAHTESALCNIMGKNALVEQLKEKKLYLQQPQASCLFKNVQGARGNPPLLHTRLKQAALCIARLSSEKEQLIEMGNHLRSRDYHCWTTRQNGCL